MLIAEEINVPFFSGIGVGVVFKIKPISDQLRSLHFDFTTWVHRFKDSAILLQNAIDTSDHIVDRAILFVVEGVSTHVRAKLLISSSKDRSVAFGTSFFSFHRSILRLSQI